jgi:hypothetical protein
MQFTPRTVLSKTLFFRTPSMMMAEIFLDSNEKKIISSCFDTKLNNQNLGFIHFMLECTRNKLWFGKNKNLISVAVYKKMVSQDLSLLKNLVIKTDPETMSDYDIENLQCAVSMLFLIKQLKLFDYKPYKDWIDNFEQSKMYTWYKNKKPFFDRCQRLK